MSVRVRRIATVIVFALVSWGLPSAEQQPSNFHVPHSGYSRGWREFVDRTKKPNTDVNIWSAEWKNGLGPAFWRRRG